MLTNSAAATRAVSASDLDDVVSRAHLLRLGCTRWQIESRIAAGRWQPVGCAIVLHNGPLTRRQRWRVALLNCGPRSALTAFTALEALGLHGWERDAVHVLAPAGVARPNLAGIRLHRTSAMGRDELLHARRCHRVAPAAVIAASTFRTPRPAVGLLAATVQRRLTSAADLRAALSRAPRTRHRAALVAAVGDIEMGAHALSEIDFIRLCRRNGLPPPTQQSVRVELDGRRRYLDAEWVLEDGRRVVVEVDGAVHLAPRTWFDDQLRQNEVTLAGAIVLRYPSVIVREESGIVVTQLRRALSCRRS
ncbi:MAG TPA: hypothetical protein VE074_02010 [Jatrophihabitantaceae bacterium]|nr:hypothetical protein [Jatrophihabitantaceae bacterium]